MCALAVNYFTSGRVIRSIATSASVCMSVCLYAVAPSAACYLDKSRLSQTNGATHCVTANVL